MIPPSVGKVVVYEHDGSWSRALRRFLSRQVSVIEAVPYESVAFSAEAAAIALVVVAGADDGRAAIQWAQRAARRRDRSLRMAVVRPADQELAWCLRETGFRWVWDEFWQVPMMAELIERFCRRHPRPDLSVEQRIWNNLPWNPIAFGPEGGATHERTD
jgi:hypothetical protein